MVLNTTEGAKAQSDSRSLRRQALLHKVPYYTTLSGAAAAALGSPATTACHELAVTLVRQLDYSATPETMSSSSSVTYRTV